MWIVRLALRRPYTFVVMSILIAVLGVMSALTTPTDVFPYINIPVAGVIWSYTGISPEDMAKRVMLISERAMTTTVNSIEHIEATAYNGVGLIRVYLQPGANIDLAMSQIVAVNQTILRTLPPGIFPPLVVQYDASSALGSIALRSCIGERRCAGSHHSRRPDRTHDSFIPGKLAQHADCLPFHPALHSHIADRLELAGRDHLRDEAVASRGAYIKAKIALQRATGTTLDSNHVAIDEAYRGSVARPPRGLPAPAR